MVYVTTSNSVFFFLKFTLQSSTCSVVSSSFLQIGHIVSVIFWVVLFYIPHVQSNFQYISIYLYIYISFMSSVLPFFIYSFIFCHLSFCIVLDLVFSFKSSVNLSFRAYFRHGGMGAFFRAIFLKKGHFVCLHPGHILES